MERRQETSAYHSTVTNQHKHVFRISGALVLLMLLFPPVFVTGYGEDLDGPTHYIFFLSSLDFGFFNHVLDMERLLTQFGLLSALTVLSLLVFRNKQ